MRSPLTLTGADEQIAMPGFRLARTWRAAGLRIPRHTHDCTNIALCASGSFDETVGGRWRRVSPGTLILRPAGEAHANHYASAASRGLIFEALPETVAAVSGYSPVLERTAAIESEDVARFARRIEGEARRRDNVSPLAIEAIAYEVIAFAARTADRSAARTTPPWLARVIEAIHADFDRSLDMAALARVAGVHPAHLARTFRARLNRTIGEYVRELRVHRGADLLRDETRTIADIAVACGFYDQSHFTRAFTRHFRVSPLRYRNRLQS